MLKTAELYDMSYTLAGAYLSGFEYPWQALKGIKELILALGPTLGEDYTEVSPTVWVHKTAAVAPTAFLGAPCIIGAGTEVRHCAFIRGSALVGEGCVVGNSVELKNAILFDNVQVPHFNYVGDSILGYKSHMGAGSVTSNVKSDKTLVVVKNGEEQVRHRAEKVRRHAGRLRGGRLQQRPESRHRHRPPLQRLPHLLRPGHGSRQQHLENRRNCCRQKIMFSGHFPAIRK